MVVELVMVSSRARRDDRVRPVGNIQGGMTLRLMGPHSRPKERHEERKGEGPEGQKLKRERNRTASLLSPFSRLVNKCGGMGVREGLHNEQMGNFG